MRLKPGRKFGAGLVFGGGGVGTEEGFNAVDLAAELKAGLNGGDVGQGEVIVGADQVIGGFEQEADAQGSFLATVNGPEGVSDF